MTLFLTALLAHMLSDFVLQPESLVQLKTEGRVKGFVIHWAVVFCVTTLFLLPFGVRISLIFSLPVSVLHIIVDIGKLSLKNLSAPFSRLYLFICDQMAHLLIIAANLILVEALLYPSSIETLLVDMGLREVASEFGEKSFGPTLDYALLILSAVVFTVFAGAHIVRLILDGAAVPLNYRIPSAGRLVGMLERFIILVLVLSGSLSAVGFVLAAKSVARFRELEDRDFAEYYLIGTLASAGLGLVAGVACRYLQPTLNHSVPLW